MTERYLQIAHWLSGSRWRIVAIAGVLSMLLQSALNAYIEMDDSWLDNLLIGMLSGLIVCLVANPAAVVKSMLSMLTAGFRYVWHGRIYLLMMAISVTFNLLNFYVA